jgi:hypothetical protein
VEVFEMVPVMIFSREGLTLFGAIASRVVAGKSVFPVCMYMYILVMAFEVGRPAEDILFARAWAGELTRIPVLFNSSYAEVRTERIDTGWMTYFGRSRYTLRGVS